MLLAIIGCDPSPDPSGTVVTYDSAGITIVDNSSGRKQQSPQWYLPEEPQLEIGLLRGHADYEFGRIGAVARLSNEILVVADESGPDIRLFDRDGDHILTVDRRGEGPGEFIQVNGLWTLAGDTIVLWDQSLQRLVCFDKGGRVVSELSLDGDYGNPIGVADRYTLVTRRMDAEGGRLIGHPQKRRSTFSLVSWTCDGATEHHDVIGSMGGYKTYAFSVNGGVGITPVPFTAHASGATADGLLFLTDGRRREIRVIDIEGRDMVRTIRVDGGERQPLRRSHVERELERRLKETPPGAREQRRALHGEMAMPELKPGYTNLIVDEATGSVWAKQFRYDYGSGSRDLEENSEWTVFDSGGALVGTFTFEAGFTLHAVHGRELVGVHRDELGVERVQMFRMKEGNLKRRGSDDRWR